MEERDGATRLGLIGMRERAELIGSEFDLESAPGEGPAIRVRLPRAAAAPERGRPDPPRHPVPNPAEYRI